MKKYYSIGEVTKVTGVSIDRLRNYDKINLLKPEYVDSKTGYRYYTGNQFRKLRFIKYLRKINVPLNEIKSILNKETDSKDFILFLEEKIKQIENEINNLNLIKEDIIELKLNMECSMKSSNIENIYVREIEERYGICKRIDKDSKFIVENREDIFAKFRSENSVLLNNTIIQKGMYLNKFDDLYNKSTKIFISTKNCKQKSNLIIPKGRYLCLSYKENNRDKAIKRLREYIQKNKIITKGIYLNVILYTMPKEEFQFQVLI